MATRTRTPTPRWQSDHQRPAHTLVSLLNQLASTASDRILYETVAENGATRRVTAGEMDQAARDVGARLQRCGAQGSRIIVVASNLVECAIGYFGCLYAGAVAVLSPAPREVIGAWHLGRVIADAGANRALVSADVMNGYGGEQLAGLEALPIVAPFSSAAPRIAVANVGWRVVTPWQFCAVAEVVIHSGSPALVNDRRLIEHVEQIVVDTRGPEAVHWVPAPSMGSEDFAHYVQHVPGAFVRVGISSSPETSHSLHNGYFDLDEKSLVPAARLIEEVLRTHLSNSPLLASPRG